MRIVLFGRTIGTEGGRREKGRERERERERGRKRGGLTGSGWHSLSEHTH